MMITNYVDWKPEDMLEVSLSDPDDFLKVRETLTRIGVASRKENKLFQSCHILHKQGRYFIVLFHELFALDGKVPRITEHDLSKRNTIACLLDDWGLLKILDRDKVKVRSDMRDIKIVPYKEKANWELIPKYSIGNKGE